MEQRDLTLIEQLAPDHPQLERLLRQHRDIEHRLETLGKHSFLTRAEQVEQRTLKKRKLAGRDQIERILRRYR